MVRGCKHRRRALALGFGVVFAGSTIGVQALAQESARTEVEEILVTGSRIAREGIDTSTPVSVIGVEEIKLSGASNVEKILSDAPQFVASTNGGASANTVPGGTADVNLRGFGASRNLVLVNGRRFAIYGPEQVTDLNTIPTALIERTEVVTGGSSAVYGSDAITGVVNFIMRDDFEGVEATAQTSYDSPTTTPTYNIDLTVGGNFAEGRGNAVVSVNYLNRGAISRGERGEWAFDLAVGWLRDTCILQSRARRRAGERAFRLELSRSRRRTGLDRGRQRRYSQRPLHWRAGVWLAAPPMLASMRHSAQLDSPAWARAVSHSTMRARRCALPSLRRTISISARTTTCRCRRNAGW